MADGAEEPALAMLVTLSGMVDGVKRYMRDKHIATPEAMKTHLASEALEVPVKFSFTTSPSVLPGTLKEAFAWTLYSSHGKELVGEKLHTDFCNAFKKEVLLKPQRKAITGR